MLLTPLWGNLQEEAYARFTRPFVRGKNILKNLSLSNGMEDHFCVESLNLRGI